MRRLGYRTIDALVERLSRPWDATPIVRTATPGELAARLGGPAPEEPVDGAVLLERLERDVLPFMARNEHPGYFAYIPGCGTWPGALGDLIASALNMDVGSWGLSAGPSAVELAVLDWFKEWIGYPRDAAGILTSGGSAANMTALACAREAVVGAMSDRLVVYCADQAHSSIARAARILGFRPDQVRVLPVDARSRLRTDALVAAMEADVRAGREPLFVAAAAGSTSTGAVDPLEELWEICRERGVWLHVDAAYGGFAAIVERGRAALAGMELADSVTLDPHKWLYQSFECGCILVRKGRQLREAFEIVPDYLKDAKGMVPRELNFADYGMQLSRTSHALKVWLSLQYFGLAAFRAAVDRCFDLIDGAARVDAHVIRGLRLFAALEPRDVDRVARMAREVDIPAGATIVEQWEVGREFYAIVEGTARVFKDGRQIDDMGPGDYFGELAALEWGASFSYPRLATVLATSHVRALVLPGPFFNELVRDAPSVGAGRGGGRGECGEERDPPGDGERALGHARPPVRRPERRQRDHEEHREQRTDRGERRGAAKALDQHGCGERADRERGHRRSLEHAEHAREDIGRGEALQERAPGDVHEAATRAPRDDRREDRRRGGYGPRH